MKIIMTHQTGYTEIVANESVYFDIQVGEHKRMLRIISDGRVMDETEEPYKEI